jgi:hypothetical protein
MESAAAIAAPNMSGAALDMMQQVLAALFACALVTGGQIHQLQVLQPAKMVVRGLWDDAHPVFEALLNKMEAATKHLQRAVQGWKAMSDVVVQAVGGDASRERSMVWGKQLQTQLGACLGLQAAAEIRDAGAAVMAEFPVKLCCDNPGCSSMGRLGETWQGCSGCKAAVYCSRECQTAHWKTGHKGVCKRVKAEAAAAAAAADGSAAHGSGAE